MAVTMLFLPFLFMIITFSSAEILQNPNFESPPANITANATTSSPYLLNTKVNAIPGWSFNGTVWYVRSGLNVSLPDMNSHAIQLGPNGKINQTITAKGAWVEFILTFTISASASASNCANNSAAVNVSGNGRSKVFTLERRFGWESYGYNLGIWDDREDPINLEIQSVSSDANQNVTCWPLVGTFLVNTRGTPKYYSDNRLSNGGFQIGPSFVRNSAKGILLDQKPDDYEDNYWPSPLQDWTIKGTVKYIDSRHYAVPNGMAAVELISGAVMVSPGLEKGSKYTLKFVIGDANDSCLGDLAVFVQVGTTEIWNFTVQSHGNGSKQTHSVMFKADTNSADTNSLIDISFASFNETQNKDNVPCGPVIDHVVVSYGLRLKLFRGVVISCLAISLTLLWITG